MTRLDEQAGELEKALERLARHAKFAEMMAESATGESVRVDTRSTSARPTPRLAGVIFRVWTGKRWAEGATSALSGQELSATVSRLENELSRAGGDAAPPGEAATTRGSWTTSAKSTLQDLGVEGTIALAKELRGYQMSVPGIVEGQVRLDWFEDERLYANSAGARCHQRILRTVATAVPIAMENGAPAYDFWSRGVVGGLELIPDMNEESMHTAAADSKALLSAKAPPTGEMEVLLDPGVAGLFAHESFGHGTEADQFVRDRSYLKPLLGQTVGPEFLSITDQGSLPGAWGEIYCDDEGHPAQKARLIDHGRFVGALHDRESAAALGAKPTGSTRRSDFQSRAFVRMTNTFVEPGDRSYEELLSEVKEGVVLEHASSGIEDPLGGQMQLKVRRGHRIQNGKLGPLVGSMALSGKVLDFLRAIRGVANGNAHEMWPGFCGKGHSDYLPVGSGGVYVLSRAIVGPA